MIPDCTLVTGCFDLTRFNAKSRNFSETINNMKSILEVPCYLVIYTDTNMVDSIKQVRNEYGLDHLTLYIVKNLEELETFTYVDIVKKNREHYHPTRDERTCAESHLVCCSKFELVLNIINLNPFHTTKFGWIDSNVGINFSKICTNYKNNMLLHVLINCSPDKFHLQILNVNDKKYIQEENLREYYNSYKWVVCGCLFITGKDVGVKILQDLNNIFIKHTLFGYGHGEEMFYLGVLDKYYDNIKRSYGDYQHILNNFVNITTGLNYIKNIANSYMNHGYYKECIDCCTKVIEQYEKYNIEIEYNLFFDFLFFNYISLFYYDKTKAKDFFTYTMKLIEKNPFIHNEYHKNKQFYDDQYKFVL
jgi:tetratricopeptide (TPR) repeat protein